VHDLVVKDNDLVIATHGRSFWILDDISPLRQISAEVTAANAFLFKPATAMRIRANTNHDTPLSPEVPAGENPPPGVVFYYYLKVSAQGEVKFEIIDGRGQLVRSYSSSDKPWSAPAPPAFPNYWFRPTEHVSTQPGMHRFVWDVRHSPLPDPGAWAGGNVEYSMSTSFGQNVPHEPQGQYALPGDYQVRITVDGKSYTQPFKLTMDPRVASSRPDLEKQFALQSRLNQGLTSAIRSLNEIHAWYDASSSDEDRAKKADALAEIESLNQRPSRRGGNTASMSGVAGALGQIAVAVDGADAAPTATQTAAADKALAQLKTLLDKWEAIRPKSK
jgi:hypothetical protein